MINYLKQVSNPCVITIYEYLLEKYNKEIACYFTVSELAALLEDIGSKDTKTRLIENILGYLIRDDIIICIEDNDKYLLTCIAEEK